MLATKEMGHVLVMHFPPCKVLYRLLSMYLLDESHMEVLRGPQSFLEDTQPPLYVILNQVNMPRYWAIHRHLVYINIQRQLEGGKCDAHPQGARRSVLGTTGLSA